MTRYLYSYFYICQVLWTKYMRNDVYSYIWRCYLYVFYYYFWYCSLRIVFTIFTVWFKNYSVIELWYKTEKWIKNRKRKISKKLWSTRDTESTFYDISRFLPRNLQADFIDSVKYVLNREYSWFFRNTIKNALDYGDMYLFLILPKNEPLLSVFHNTLFLSNK